MGQDILSLCRRIQRIYADIDRETSRVRRITGLICPPGCGSCCRSRKVESTPLELLPMVHHLVNIHAADEIIAQIDGAEIRGDLQCVLFRPELDDSMAGCCSQYAHRPVLCRMFGFGARLNKFGDIQPHVCRVMHESQPEALERLIALGGEKKVPLYRSYFFRVASLKPDIGFKPLPINRALKLALNYYYWKKPKRFGIRLAS
ncbi:YkgJ family cysteine cluster protein [bacterium]|nr:YkgJ family cysteine cluster protein [candidate division CSSED10-310 bacterium]